MNGIKNRIVLVLLAFLPCQSEVWAQGTGDIRDVSFEAEIDGSVQHYIQILPREFDPTKPRDVLIALHGHGSNRWQFATGEIDEARAARDVAEHYRMIFISPDYRASTSWMGPKAERDVVQIICRVKRQFPVDKVLVSGASMGGSSSLTFAVLHPDLVDGVVSINGTANHLEYENCQGAIRESFGGTKQEIPMEYKNRSAEYFPDRLTMPIAITAGGLDETVPPDSVLRLAKILEKLNPDTLLLHRPEGGHSTDYEDSRQAFEFVIERMNRRRSIENP